MTPTEPSAPDSGTPIFDELMAKRPGWIDPAPECSKQFHAHDAHDIPYPDGTSVPCPGMGLRPEEPQFRHANGQECYGCQICFAESDVDFDQDDPKEQAP